VQNVTNYYLPVLIIIIMHKRTAMEVVQILNISRTVSNCKIITVNRLRKAELVQTTSDMSFQGLSARTNTNLFTYYRGNEVPVLQFADS